MLAFILLTWILLAGWGLLHRHWNNAREAKLYSEEATLGDGQSAIENVEFADLTDKQLRSFRYPL